VLEATAICRSEYAYCRVSYPRDCRVLNQAEMVCRYAKCLIYGRVRSLCLGYIKVSSLGEGSTSHNNLQRLFTLFSKALQTGLPQHIGILNPIVPGLDTRQARGCIYDTKQIEAPINHVRLISAARIRTLAIYTIYRWRHRCGHRLRHPVMRSHLPPVQKPYMVLHSLRYWSPGQSQSCHVASPN
jgi:hypothetical protein